MPNNSGSRRSPGYAAALAALAHLRQLGALEARLRAQGMAERHGHKLGPWQTERAPDDGWFARCNRCDLYALVVFTERGRGVEIDGSAPRVRCRGRFITVPYWAEL